MTHMFKESLKAGKAGERIFLNLLLKAGVTDILDVSENRSIQKKGYDYVVCGKKLDVKFDVRATTTGNIAFEIVSQRKEGKIVKEGWLHTSEADVFMYITFLDDSVAFIALTKPEIISLIENYGKGERSVRNYSYESVVVPVDAWTCLNSARHFTCRIGEEYDELALHDFISSIFDSGEV